MKINVPSLLAGICIAISGSIFASSASVPYIFTSGQKAKASEVNANFSSLAEAISELSGKLSNVENNVSTVSDFVGATTKEIIPISQIDLPIGSKFTIHGIQYTIVQFEFPRFDTDESYLIKYPSSTDFSKIYASEYISVYGRFKGELFNEYDQLKIAMISGFPATIGDGFTFGSNLRNNDEGRSASASFTQASFATIGVGPSTFISIGFSYSNKVEVLNPIRSSNASDISHAYPPTPLEAEREKIRSDLRTLLNYIVIQKKE